MKSSTQFSFIVSSYNYVDYLGECLNSLINQNYDKDSFEIICVDDGSLDGSVSMIQEVVCKHPNVRLLQTDRLGIEKVCNAGIRASKFPFVVRVDADDFLDINFLEVMSKAITVNPGFSFYYPKSYILFSKFEDNVLRELPDFDPEEIYRRGDFLATGTVYLKEVLKEIDFYPEQHRNCGLENYALILELLNRDYRGIAVSGTKLYYRRHQKNMSITELEAILNYGESLLAKYGRHYQTNDNHPYQLKHELKSLQIDEGMK